MLIREDLYKFAMRRFLSDGIVNLDDRILVLCGGGHDLDVFTSLGFKNVVISNLDDRIKEGQFKPYEWSFQDAEHITFNEEEFDFCVVHSGLHHCFSPHRALLEMYRVCRKGIILFEPCDNWLTRLGVRLGLGQDYEHAAVAGNELRWGGVKNTAIPNFVYRFTEREIIKTIHCFAPHAPHQFQFIYATRIPWFQLRKRKNKLFLMGVIAGLPFIYAFNFLFPKLSNNFAAIILKPDLKKNLFPWLELADEKVIALNKEWFSKTYRTPDP